jgi:hypothetical protein
VFHVVHVAGGRHHLTSWIGVTVRSAPFQKPGGIAVGFEALARGVAAEGVGGVVGMMAVADQNTNGPIDGRQLGHPGQFVHPRSQRAWRHIGIKGDSAITLYPAAPLIIGV